MSGNIVKKDATAKPMQKLVSFTEKEMGLMKQELDGWKIVSLTSHGNRYVGVVEKVNSVESNDNSIYIPPRKKLKIWM